jgi:hypothetical protein
VFQYCWMHISKRLLPSSLGAWPAFVHNPNELVRIVECRTLARPPAAARPQATLRVLMVRSRIPSGISLLCVTRIENTLRRTSQTENCPNFRRGERQVPALFRPVGTNLSLRTADCARPAYYARCGAKKCAATCISINNPRSSRRSPSALACRRGPARRGGPARRTKKRRSFGALTARGSRFTGQSSSITDHR